MPQCAYGPADMRGNDGQPDELRWAQPVPFRVATCEGKFFTTTLRGEVSAWKQAKDMGSQYNIKKHTKTKQNSKQIHLSRQ